MQAWASSLAPPADAPQGRGGEEVRLRPRHGKGEGLKGLAMPAFLGRTHTSWVASIAAAAALTPGTLVIGIAGHGVSQPGGVPRGLRGARPRRGTQGGQRPALGATRRETQTGRSALFADAHGYSHVVTPNWACRWRPARSFDTYRPQWRRGVGSRCERARSSTWRAMFRLRRHAESQVQASMLIVDRTATSVVSVGARAR